MNKFKLVLWIIILGIIALVIFQNQEFFFATQSLQIKPWVSPVYRTPEIPIAVIFLVFFVFGLVLAFIFGAPQRFKNRKTIKRLTAEKASQKDEIEKLKNEIDSLKGVRAAAVAEGAESAAVEGVSSDQADEASQQTDKAEN